MLRGNSLTDYQQKLVWKRVHDDGAVVCDAEGKTERQGDAHAKSEASGVHCYESSLAPLGPHWHIADFNGEGMHHKRSR